MMSHAALVLRHLDIALIAISSLVFILRLYARLVVIKNPGWDDALAFCAFCFGVAMSTMEIRRKLSSIRSMQIEGKNTKAD